MPMLRKNLFASTSLRQVFSLPDGEGALRLSVQTVYKIE